MAEINEELNENDDSLGNKMDQIYENSQKKEGFEIHNSQRPISKYDRNQQIKQNLPSSLSFQNFVHSLIHHLVYVETLFFDLF